MTQLFRRGSTATFLAISPHHGFAILTPFTSRFRESRALALHVNLGRQLANPHATPARNQFIQCRVVLYTKEFELQFDYQFEC